MQASEMQEILLDIKDRVTRVETKIDTYNNYREKTEKAYHIACENEKDIREIKDGQKWLWRTIAGAILVAFLAATIQFK